MTVTLYKAEARNIPLPDNGVQCVVTSPPYWGLRKYAGEQELAWGGDEFCQHDWTEKTDKLATGGKTEKQVTNRGATGDGFSATCATCATCGAWRGSYGLEPTIEMYVAHTVEILREVRRVLRPDGVVFWNVGDSYAANRGYQVPDSKHVDVGNNHGSKVPEGLKPKDLCLIPSRVALAAQADGWWVRSMIIWNKPNPMPESVTDRPTDAYEHIFMLTKSARYFWDADAVREEAQYGKHHARYHAKGDSTIENNRADQLSGDNRGLRGGYLTDPLHRNLRNVWTFPTQPYKGAHFATFPEELPRRCIFAATSAKGACAQCGAPWERIIKRTGQVNKREPAHVPNNSPTKTDSTGWRPTTVGTNGWTPTCLCRGQRGKTVPCLVLDPFGGSGTTGRVAQELGRDAAICDIAYGVEGGYEDLAVERINGAQTIIEGFFL